jgi:hypothetical protein
MKIKPITPTQQVRHQHQQLKQVWKGRLQNWQPFALTIPNSK